MTLRYPFSPPPSFFPTGWREIPLLKGDFFRRQDFCGGQVLPTPFFLSVGGSPKSKTFRLKEKDALILDEESRFFLAFVWL